MTNWTTRYHSKITNTYKFFELIREIWLFSFIALSLLLNGCTPNYQKRLEAADQLAAKYNYSKKLVKAGDFTFTTYQKINKPNAPYVIYIEGDGLAWKGRSTISTNPTPTSTIFLELALMDPRPNVVYLARPCQYTPMKINPNCNFKHWTDERFSEQSVSSMNKLVQKVTEGNRFNLIGFSGGGGVAALIAARNDKVNSLITLAGTLDHVKLHKHHSVTQLKNSYNPIEFADKLKAVPQIHYSGSVDRVMPPMIAKRFVEAVDSPNASHVILEGVSHNENWHQYKQKFYTNLK